MKHSASVKTALLILLFSFSFIAQNCAWGISAQEKFIQGEWEGREEGTHPPPPEMKGPTLGIYVNWKFNKGNFNFVGYPPLKQEGKYRVIKETPDSITLEFYDQKGDWGSEKSQRTFFINRSKDELKEAYLMHRKQP